MSLSRRDTASGRCEGALIATEESHNFVVETLRGVYPEPVEGLRVTCEIPSSNNRSVS